MGLTQYAAPAVSQVSKVAITFDDGFDSVYSIAYPYLAAYGIKATAYVTKNYIDTAGYMTTANLTTLYNAGWDICNHSVSHTNYTTLTQAQIEADLTECSNWLYGLGFTRSSHHVAYPNGGYDADVEAAMVALNMSSGRLSDSTIEFNYASGITSLRQIHCYDTGSVLDTALTAYFSPLKKNYASVLLWHDILATGPIVHGYEMLQADFEDFIDYIVLRAVPTLTITELYTILRGTLSYSLTADAGSIVVTGQDATLTAYLKKLGCVTAADTGLYTVTAADTCLYTVTASDMRCT